MKKLLGVLATSLYLAGCGGGGSGAPAAPAAESFSSQADGQTTATVGRMTVHDNVNGPFSLMGTITGLLGDGLSLHDGWGSAIMVNGMSFLFQHDTPANSEYSVRVSSQPVNPTQFCTIENNHGRATTTVSNIAVSCAVAAKFAIVAQKTPSGGTLETFAYDQATGNIGEQPVKSHPFLAPESDLSKSLRLIRNPKKSAVYLVSEQRKLIEAYAIDEREGKLTRMLSLISDSPREGVAINAAGTRIYSLVAETSNVVVSALGENGQFLDGKHVTWTTFAGEELLSLQLSADEKHLYATSKSGTIFTLEVAANGDLSRFASITGYDGLNGLAISPQSKFAFASTDNWDSISFLTVNTAGKLTFTQDFTFAGQFSNLRGLTFDPKGNFLFGVDSSRGSLFAFKIDQKTGEPTLVSITPIDPKSNQGVTFDPTGKFLYVSAGNTTGFVKAFALNDQTGALTPMSILQTGLATAHALYLY